MQFEDFEPHRTADASTGLESRLESAVRLAMCAAAGEPFGDPDFASDAALEALFEVHPRLASMLAYALTCERGPEFTARALELLSNHEPGLAARRAADLVDDDSPIVRIAALQALVVGDPARAHREISRMLDDTGEDQAIRSTAAGLLTLVESAPPRPAEVERDLVLAAAKLALVLHGGESEAPKWQRIRTPERIAAFEELEREGTGDPVLWGGVVAACEASAISSPRLRREVLRAFEEIVNQDDPLRFPQPEEDSSDSLPLPGSRRAGRYLFEPAAAAAGRSGRPQHAIHHDPQTEKAWLEQLKQGRVPEELAEESRVVDPESEAGRAFQVAMESFARELLGTEYDFDATPLRFLLVDTDQVQAGYLRGSHPPVFLFGRGLFAPGDGEEPVVATSEDLAWVMLHELFHSEVRIKYGDELPVTKVEEGAAYFLPLAFMHDRGMSPERALHTHEKLFNAGSRHGRSIFGELLDEHPVGETTKSGLETALAVLRSTRGDLRAKTAPHHFSTADELISAVREGVHRAFVDEKLDAHAEYDTLDAAGKISRLGELLAELQTPVRQVRLIDFVHELRTVTASGMDEAARSAARELAARILETDLPIGTKRYLYRPAADAASPERETIPVGRLLPLAERVKEFAGAVETGDRAAMHEAALALNRAAESEPFMATNEGRWFLSMIAWPSFQMPDLSNVRIEEPRYDEEAPEPVADDAEFDTPIAPWHPLRAAAREDEAVLRAALLLGFYRDPEIQRALANFPELSLPLYESMPAGHSRLTSRMNEGYTGIPELSPGPRGDPPAMRVIVVGGPPLKAGLDDVAVDAEGRITEVFPPYRMDASGRETGGRETPQSAAARIRAENLRTMAEGLLERADEPDTAEKLDRIAALLKPIDRAPFMFERDDTATDTLLGLDALTLDSLPLFRRLNQKTLGSEAGAERVCAHFQKLIEGGDEHAPQLIRAFFGLDHTRLRASCLREVSASIWQSGRSRFDMAPGEELVGNSYFKFLRNVSPDVLPDAEKCRVFRIFLRRLVDSGSIQVNSADEARVVLDFMRPVAEGGGAGAAYRANSWGEFLSELRAPELVAHFDRVQHDRFLPGRHRPRLSEEARRAELAAVLLQAKLFVLTEDAAPPSGTELLEAARIMRWTSAGILAAPIKLTGMLAELGSGRFDSVLTDAPLHEALRNFTELRRAGLLTATGQRLELGTLVERLEAARQGPQRRKMAAALLRSGHVDDPQARAALHSVWVDDLVREIGVDDGSAAYRARFIRAFADTQHDAWLGQRGAELVSRYDDYTLLREAAKRTVAQPELARAMQTYAMRFDARDSFQLFLGGHGLDVVLEGARRNPGFREAAIDFLTTPYTEDSALAFRTRCTELFPGTRRLQSGEDPRGPHAAERFGTWLRNRLDEERWLTKNIYDNFWAAPLVLRIGAVRELLLPEADAQRTKLRETPQEVAPETFDFVMRKVLPGNASESELARRAIRSWISHVSPYEKHFKLAGLLVATEPSYEGSQSVAERLAAASGAMNSFVKKVAQRVPGLPFVDAEFAAPFERLTFAASDESRWQVLDWVRERKEAICDAYHRSRAQRKLRPAQDADEHGRVYIKRYGEVLGAGSLFVTIELEMSDRTNHVLAMRRPNALETADEEYRIAKSTVADIRERTHAWDALTDLMTQVNERMRLEVNCRAAHAQYELAEEIYGSHFIEIDGEAVPTEVVRVTAAGQDFYMMTKAEGAHLIEALNDDSIPAERRSRLLQAALTFDLSRMLRGRFDADRTGGQTRVNGKLSMFDFKALALEPWSEPGLEQFGALLVRAASRLGSPGELMNGILDEERVLRERHEPISPFLGEAKMLLLTLARYMKPGYLEPEEVKRCAVSAVLGGVHPAVARGALREIPEPLRELASDVLGTKVDPARAQQARAALLAMLGMEESELIRISRKQG